jgi:DNA-binding MarR family transcriptional regulator
LAQTCKLLRRCAYSQLDEVGLYRGQQFILNVLWGHEGLAHSELAHKLQVQPATITNALKRMEKAGWVVRRPDEADQRVSRVYLTDAGRGIRGAVERAWSEVDERAFAGFSPAERTQLGELLARIRENLAQAGLERRRQR